MLKPEVYETMWKAFHQFRLKSVSTWVNVLKSLNISHSGQFTKKLFSVFIAAGYPLLILRRGKTVRSFDDSFVRTSFLHDLMKQYPSDHSV